MSPPVPVHHREHSGLGWTTSGGMDEIGIEWKGQGVHPERRLQGRRDQIKSLFYVIGMIIFSVIGKNVTQPDGPWAFTSHKLILPCHLVKTIR